MSVFDHISFAESYRAKSEDRVAIFEREDSLIIALADGVGGRSGGAEAADAVMNAVRATLADNTAQMDAEFWRDVLMRVDRMMASDGNAGETTAIVVELTATRLVGASVGDSEAWIIANDGYSNLTQSQRRKPYLGSGMAYAAPFRAECFDGTLLVASDGLFKYTTAEKICKTVLQSSIFDPPGLVRLVRPRNSERLYDDVAIAMAKRRI